MATPNTTLWLCALSLALTACTTADDDKDSGEFEVGDMDSDADTDADTDADSDADTDADTDTDTDADTDADTDTDPMPVAFEGTLNFLERDEIAEETRCDVVLNFPGIEYTGTCEGCDFAFEVTPSLLSASGTEPEDCVDEAELPAKLYMAHAPTFTMGGGYGGYGYGYDDYEDYVGYETEEGGGAVSTPDTGWYEEWEDTGDWGGGGYYGSYTFTDVFLIGNSYYPGSPVFWYPAIFTTPYGYSYGEFTWDGDHIVADQMNTWSGTDLSYSFMDWCEGGYYYDYYDDYGDVPDGPVLDTGGWYYYDGPDPVEGDQVHTGTLACGDESEMPYADVYTTTSILEEGDTLTVTMDGSVEDLQVWINGADSCIVASSWWTEDDCPGEAIYCQTASAEIESADTHQVVIQRDCWWESDEVADYTLRADSASYECASETCPEPELLTLDSDDVVAAEETEYSETSGWRIEGDLIWE